MVKKWIIMICIMIALGIGCVFESIYVNRSFDNLVDSLELLQTELDSTKEKIDEPYLFEKADKIHKSWHKRVKILKCLIWHTGIKDVEVGLARIEVYIEENDYTEASAEISSLIDYLEHYSDDFSISWENIF